MDFLLQQPPCLRPGPGQSFPVPWDTFACEATVWHCKGPPQMGGQLKPGRNPRLRVKPHWSQFGHLPFLLPAAHRDTGVDFVIGLAGVGQQNTLVELDTAFQRGLELAK